MPAQFEQDPAITAKLVEALRSAPGIMDRADDTSRMEALDASNAALDAAAPLGHHTRILAAEALATCTEHLFVWQHLLVKGQLQPLAAHMTLLRGAMEGAVTCRWLIDPSVGSRDRVRRGVAYLLEDYSNRRDFERDMGLPTSGRPPPAKSGHERHAELLKASKAAHIRGGSVLGMTERFARYGVPDGAMGRAMFRLLSAYAHGKQWAYLTSKFVEDLDRPRIAGGRMVQVTGSDQLSLVLTQSAVATATHAAREMDAYLGVAGAATE